MALFGAGYQLQGMVGQPLNGGITVQSAGGPGRGLEVEVYGSALETRSHQAEPRDVRGWRSPRRRTIPNHPRGQTAARCTPTSLNTTSPAAPQPRVGACKLVLGAGARSLGRQMQELTRLAVGVGVVGTARTAGEADLVVRYAPIKNPVDGAVTVTATVRVQ